MKHGSQRSGFTLVELLVVIGIIAMLIAILMPALVRAQQNADRVNCLARLRQIGLAAQLHQLDHHGYLPIAGWHYAGGGADPRATQGHIATPEGFHDTAEQRYIYYLDSGLKRPVPLTAALGHYMQAPVDLSSRANLTASLNAEPLKRLFCCPAQNLKQLLSGMTQHDDADKWTAPVEFSGYVFNEAVLGMRSPRSGIIDPTVGNTVRIRHPSTVMLAADGRPRNQEKDNWLMVFNRTQDDTLYDFQQNVMAGGWGKQTFDHDRHQGTMNVLFVDGHAENISTAPLGLKAVGISKGIYD